MSISGMRLLYLPPYSPDYNPIEQAFSCFKSWLRLNKAIVTDAFEDEEEEDEGVAVLMLALMESCTPLKALEWFRHCGYF